MAKDKSVLKQSLTLGLGLMDLTKEKLDKMVKEINKGISEKDKKDAVEDLMKRARSARKETEKVLRAQVKKVMDEMKKKAPAKKSAKKKKKSSKKRA
jgi:polyhydroxyalkanoate synthesis regulator phasin